MNRWIANLKRQLSPSTTKSRPQIKKRGLRVESLESRITPAAPVINLIDHTMLSVPEQTATAVASTLTVTDTDAPASQQVASATVQISAGSYQAGEDVLSYNAALLGSLTTTGFNATNGSITFSGIQSADFYQSLLRSVTFTDTKDAPNTGTNRTVSFAVNGPAADPGTTIDSRIVHVVAVPDAPVITSNGGGATASINVPENTTAVTTVTATNPDGGAAPTYGFDTTHGFVSAGADYRMFFINPTTGVLTFNSAPDYEAPADANTDNTYDVIVTVTSSGLTTTQAMAVTVTPVNDHAPVITSSLTPSVPENTTFVEAIVVNDPDLPAQTFTYTLSGNDAAKFAISPTGVLSFVNAPNFEAPNSFAGTNVYDVTVTVNDNGTNPGPLTTTNAFHVTVTNVNEPPVITSNGGGATASLSVPENTPAATILTTVTATDPDAGETLAYSLTGPDAAQFTLNASNQLTFIASPNFEMPTDANHDNVYDVTVNVTDNGAPVLSATQDLSITVTNVNEAPVITSNGGGNSANISVAQHTIGVTTVTSTDVDAGQTVTYSISGADASQFAINSSTGVLTFKNPPVFATPTDANSDGIYQVTVIATDNGSPALSDSQDLNVTVTNVPNSPPVITSPAVVSIPEKTKVVETVTATDPDLPAQTLTFNISGGPDAALFTVSPTGVLSFVNAPTFADAHGPAYHVTVQVTDNGSPPMNVTQAITVNVTNTTNANPVITSYMGASPVALSVPENTLTTTTVATIQATDPNVPAQTLTYSISGGADAARFNINASTGALTFQVSPNYEAPADSGGDNTYDVVLQATDSGGQFATQTFAITVTPVNEFAPVINSNSGAASVPVRVPENTSPATQIAQVTATDADLPAQTFTYTLSGADAAKFAVSSAGVLTFVAAPDYEHPTDAGADNVYNVTVTVNDNFNGTPNLTASQSFVVTVTPVNEFAPVITSNGGTPTARIYVQDKTTAAVTTVTATDADLPAPTFTYSVGGTDGGLFNINASTGVLTFKTPPSYDAPQDAGLNNVYNVTVTANDNGTFPAPLSSTPQNLIITVINTNQTPVMTGGPTRAVSVPENTTFVATVAATDPDAGQRLTYSITGGADASKFAVDPSTGDLTFLTAPNFEAPTDAGANNVYDVIVSATDNGSPALSASQAIAVTVLNVNEPPAITSNGGGATATINVAQHTINVTTVTATDPDAGQTLTFTKSGPDVALFNLNSSTGVLTFATPQAPGTYYVNVTATDNGTGNLAATQALTVIVYASSNAPPTINSNGGGATAAVSVPENTTAVTTVSATDADLPAQTLTYSISGGADAAKFTINPSTGVLSFVTAPNFEAPTDAGANNVYDVIVAVTDSGTPAMTTTQAIAVTVTNVNEPPVITSSATASVPENTSAVTTVTATDPDAGETLTYSISGGLDAALFAINPSTGLLSFLTAPDYEQPTDAGANNVYDVNVEVTDNGTGNLTATQAIAVTVTPVNDNAPVITSSPTVSVPENTTAVTTVSATDADLPAQTLTYSIFGGADAAKFTINPSTGVLSFVTAPNFEAPTDVGANNVYDVIVAATDSGTPGLTTTQAIAVTVTNVNEPPVITSNGGGATASVSVPENTTAVTTVSATDADLPAQTLTYSISGGADAAKFTINPSTGVLSFVTAPNFEAPTDVGANNVYDVIVAATDSGTPAMTITQAIAVTVTNVNEPPVATTTTLTTSNANPPVNDQSTVFTATVAGAVNQGAPTGFMAFYSSYVSNGITYKSFIGYGSNQGNGAWTFNPATQYSSSFWSTAGAVYTISAHYYGDANYNPSDSNGVTETVSNTAVPKTNTTTTLTTSNANPPVNDQSTVFTATVAGAVNQGAPTGFMAFYSTYVANGVPHKSFIGYGSNQGNGVWTFNPATQYSSSFWSPAGAVYTISAHYYGDANYNPSDSNNLTATV